jgi:hypothetical protein
MNTETPVKPNNQIHLFDARARTTVDSGAKFDYLPKTYSNLADS